MADPSPLRLLVVGTGHGARIHVPAARAAGFVVAGLVGTDAERTRQIADRNGIAQSFTDLEAAIEATRAEAVAVASPPASHAAHALTSARLGCHVYCEKPLGLDAAQCAAMLDAAESAGVVHAVGNQFRHLPQRRAVATALAEGRIGTVQSFALVQHLPLLASPGFRMPDWFYRQREGGGWLNASGTHMLDMLRDWLGEVARVDATLEGPREQADLGYGAHLRMSGGASGVVQQTAVAQGAPTSITRVVGSEGTIAIEGDKAMLYRGTTGEELASPFGPLPRPPEPAQAGGTYSHVELPPSIAAFAGWAEAIRRPEARSAHFASFADGLATMRVVDAIRRSAQTSLAVNIAENPGDAG